MWNYPTLVVSENLDLSKMTKHKSCAIKEIELWCNIIVESVFVDWFLNACKYMFVYILHTFVK